MYTTTNPKGTTCAHNSPNLLENTINEIETHEYHISNAKEATSYTTEEQIRKVLVSNNRFLF